MSDGRSQDRNPAIVVSSSFQRGLALHTNGLEDENVDDKTMVTAIGEEVASWYE